MVDALHRALAEPSRARLMATLAEAPDPLSADELARQFDLHVNTVRAHLDLLEGAGLVLGEIEHLGRRGRPRRVYVAVDGRDGERAVGRMLVEGLAALDEGPTLARRLGRDRGRRLAEAKSAARPAGRGRIEELVRMLARTGFAPVLSASRSGCRVEMQTCPMRELADAHPGIVCTLHQGVIEGFLAQRGDDDVDVELEVRPAPGPCIARLRTPRERGAAALT
jgi:predicted ArsR family transcriptional regulator